MTPPTPSLAQINDLANRGELALALTLIEQKVAQAPSDGHAWHLAGIIRRKAGQFDAAVEALAMAITCGRSGAEVWNSLGLALEDAGRAGDAEAAFAAAVERDPAYTAALTNRARLLGKLGRGEEGEAVLRAALARQPDMPDLLNALGSLLIDLGRADEAEPVYRRSLAIRSDSRPAVIRLGQSLREQGRSDEALELYRAHRARVGDTPEFVNALAGVLVENGLWHEAETELERLCQAVPGYFQGHKSLARLAREYGTGTDCYRSFRRLARDHPDQPGIWLEWIALLLHYRDYAEALDVIEAASARFSSEQLVYAKAVALSETGEPQRAEDLFRQLESTSPGMSQSCLTARARNAIMLQDAAMAERLSMRAMKQDATDQFALAYLGLAWRLLGDAREAWLHDYDVQAQQIELAFLQDAARMEALRDHLRSLHRAMGHPPDQSLRQGTQTEGALLSRPHPLLRELREAIGDVVAGYMAGLPDDPQHPFYSRKASSFRFVGSWSVRLTTQGFHIAHVHNAGWLSSALHLVVPPRREHEHRDAGKLVLGEPPVELNTGLGPRRVVTPREGHLVLFPSSMWHGTKPFAGGQERLTVAFDALPA